MSSSKPISRGRSLRRRRMHASPSAACTPRCSAIRAVRSPPPFIDQLVHVILRNLLDRCDDVFMLRAAELFFRPQRLTVHDGSLIAADEEKVTGVSPQPASPLVAMLGLPVAGEIDVLNDGNAESYWERSDLFDMALD